MQIYGSYGSALANGKLAFGSYGIDVSIFNARRVFVGEFGNNIDSDKLELCGSIGHYLTWGQGYDFNNIIGKSVIDWEIINNVLTEVPKFQFSLDVYAKGIILNSDERFKENIEPVNSPLVKLKKVRGVSYNFKNEQTTSPPNSGFESEGTEKEQTDLALLAETNEKLQSKKKTRIGFIAEEIKEIFPGLVEEDTDGYLHVDYLGLVPVLVESLKEQQNQIALLKTVLK